MVSFNIDEFKSRLTTGLLRNNKFVLQLDQLPHGMQGTKYASLYPYDLRFYCESVDIPGSILQTNNIKRYGYGPLEKKPYMPAFADCQVVFRSDQEGKVFNFIRQWQALAVNYQMRSSNAGQQNAINDQNGYSNPKKGLGGQAQRLLTPYELGYKRQYAVGVQIFMYSEDGKSESGIVLREAYPVVIADMPLAWAQTKSYAQLPVAFSFVDMMFFDNPAT